MTIHMMLITPRANSDAISAQQQPTHHRPFLIPMRTDPVGPSRHEPSSAPSGLRHLPRHSFFKGVNGKGGAPTGGPPPPLRRARPGASPRGNGASARAGRATPNPPAPARAGRKPPVNPSG